MGALEASDHEGRKQILNNFAQKHDIPPFFDNDPRMADFRKTYAADGVIVGSAADDMLEQVHSLQKRIEELEERIAKLEKGEK